MRKTLIIIPVLLFSILCNAQFTKGGGTFLKTGSGFMTAPVIQSPFPQVASITLTNSTLSDATSHPITIPATLNVGDLLLVFFSCDGTTTTDPLSIDAANSGDNWTHADPLTESGSQMAGVFYKIADGDDNSLTVLSSDAQISIAQTYRITNFHVAVPLKVIVGTSTTNQYPDPPSGTGDYGADDYLWIVAYSADSWDSYSTAAPADFTNLTVHYYNATGGTSSINTARREHNTGDAYDPGTFTSYVDDEAWRTYTVIINPIQ